MFDFNMVQKRYWLFKTKNGNILHVNPAKLKLLAKLEAPASSEDFINAFAAVLSSNKANTRITAEMLNDWLDADQLKAAVTDYVQWLQDTRENSPN